MEKERRTKALAVVVLLIVVAGLTVAFAALSTTLNINGTAYLDAAKWGIKFENLSSPTKIGSATTTGTAKIEETKSAEITGINVGLSTPGDKVTYTVDLVNKGTINAKIDNIEKTVLTSEQQRYLTFRVTDKNGNEVSEGDILSAGETRNLTITIEFIKDLTKEDLPKQTSTISLSYKLNFVQTDDKATSGSQEPSSQACTSFDKKDTYNVGDVIALCNTSTNKSEDFYVMKDNGTTVTALAKYNLLVGNTVVLSDDFSDKTVTPISTSEEGYGLQNSSVAVWKMIQQEEDGAEKLSTNKIRGTIAFSNTAYWNDSKGNRLSQYSSSVFDSNSLLYKPLKNYENYVKNILGKASVTTNIITLDELVSLGCNKNQYCPDTLPWLYSVNYWTQATNYTDSFFAICSIDGWMGYHGYLNNVDYDNIYYIGLRPVITIKKSEL